MLGQTRPNLISVFLLALAARRVCAQTQGKTYGNKKKSSGLTSHLIAIQVSFTLMAAPMGLACTSIDTHPLHK
jgi:hypothetical protein